jgi:predicted small secreted protein
MNELYIILGIALAILTGMFVAVFVSVEKHLSSKKMMRMIENFPSYAAVLEYHQKKAYEIIHRDEILIYSIEATRLPDEQFNEVSKKFVKLVEKMMGPKLFEEFIYLYGNEDVFIFNMVEYFNTTYEDDEIRQSSMESFMEDEDVSR